MKGTGFGRMPLTATKSPANFGAKSNIQAFKGRKLTHPETIVKKGHQSLLPGQTISPEISRKNQKLIKNDFKDNQRVEEENKKALIAKEDPELEKLRVSSVKEEDRIGKYGELNFGNESESDANLSKSNFYQPIDLSPEKLISG